MPRCLVLGLCAAGVCWCPGQKERVAPTLSRAGQPTSTRFPVLRSDLLLSDPSRGRRRSSRSSLGLDGSPCLHLLGPAEARLSSLEKRLALQMVEWLRGAVWVRLCRQAGKTHSHIPDQVDTRPSSPAHTHMRSPAL